MQIPHSICMGRGIEGDGVSDELFHYLWTKDELNFSPPINIPDTVFLKYGSPTVWYFTSKDGKIKRKNHQNLTPTHIETAFKKNSLGFDVIAMFINIPLEIESYSDDFPSSTIEYLDEDGLKNVLYSRNKDLHGILQRFIEPKATKNEVIRAIWSPKICLLEKAENIHCLHDKFKHSIYERCVTFEGPQGYFQSAPLRGPVLAGQIQRICDSLVSHVCDVSFNSIQVSRMAINFKVDSRDKIWMLFTTSLRCKCVADSHIQQHSSSYHPSRSISSLLSNKPINLGNSLILPSSVMLSSSQTHELIAESCRMKCPSCADDTIADKTYPVSYKSLIKQHEYFLTIAKEHVDSMNIDDISYPPVDDDIIQACKGVGFGVMKDIPVLSDDYIQRHGIIRPDYHIRSIPPIVLDANPRLDHVSYVKCCDDDNFLMRTVNVCERCCLAYTEFTTKTLIHGCNMKKLHHNIIMEQQSSLSSSSMMMSHHHPITQSLPIIIGSKDIHDIEKKMIHHNKFIPSINHVEAKKNMIGVLSYDTPSFPAAIIDVDHHHSDDKPSTANSMRTMTDNDDDMINDDLHRMSLSYHDDEKKKIYNQQQLNIRVNDKFFNSIASSYNVDNIAGMIAERQRIYIEELIHEQEVVAMKTFHHDDDDDVVDDDKKQDDHHIISSSDVHVHEDDKVKTKNKISSSTSSSSSNHKYHAYKQEIPYIVKGQKIYESKLRRKLRLEGMKKQKYDRLLDQHHPDDHHGGNNKMLSSSPSSLSNQEMIDIENRIHDSSNDDGIMSMDMIAAITSGSRSHLRFLQEAMDEIHFEDAYEIGLQSVDENHHIVDDDVGKNEDAVMNDNDEASHQQDGAGNAIIEDKVDGKVDVALDDGVTLVAEIRQSLLIPVDAASTLISSN